MSEEIKDSRIKREQAFRKQLMVEAAEKLFNKLGYTDTTMDLIAKESEFSKPTLYNYFKSKDELALHVYIKNHNRKMEFIWGYVKKFETGADKLRAFGEAYYRYFEKNPEHLKLQVSWDYLGFNRDNIRDEDMDEMDIKLKGDYSSIDELYNQGIKDGTLRGDIDFRNTLELFYLTTRAVMNQILIINKESKFGSLNDFAENQYFVYLDLFMKALRP